MYEKAIPVYKKALPSSQLHCELKFSSFPKSKESTEKLFSNCFNFPLNLFTAFEYSLMNPIQIKNKEYVP